MANPFKVKFDSECQNCGNWRYKGDEMFHAEDGSFICEVCAEENGNVCPKCGDFKKQAFPFCYNCGHDVVKPPSWGPAKLDEDDVEIVPDDSV